MFNKNWLFLPLMAVMMLSTGCRRDSNEVWEDTKSASRHVKRGVGALGGKHGDSRQVRSRDEFYSEDGTSDRIDFSYRGGRGQNDFVAIPDADNGNEIAMADYMSAPPRESPGDPGSSLPGIDSFQDPGLIPGLSKVFRNINFGFDQYTIKDVNNINTVNQVADYLKKHENTYVFIEGHADDRGAQAYNMSLGSKRSNSVRNLLIQDGVNPDQLFTISYGHDRPLVMERHEEAWSQNRRVEFKIYQK